MTTFLYDKSGQQIEIRRARDVANMVSSGSYFPAPPVPRTVVTKEKADTNTPGKSSPKEVRSAAEVLGFADWRTANIKDLRDRIWPPST